MNFSIDAKTANLFCKLNSFKYLLTKTERFVESSLKKVKNPYVACSFGKDSAAMLFIVRKFMPDIPVIFIRRIETDLIDNFKEVIDMWGNINISILSYKGFLEGGKTGGLARTTKDLDYDSYFVGLRAEESHGRRLSLKVHGNFYVPQKGKIRICPMAEWKTIDIACYCVENNIPVVSKYAKEGFSARTTANISSSFPEETIAWVKRNSISDFNKLVKLLPEVKNYV